MNYSYSCRRLTHFVLLIAACGLLMTSPALSQPALQEIADQMDATLKAVGDHATLFTIQRDGNPNNFPGISLLVLSGYESRPNGRCFREEIYEYGFTATQAPSRQLAVFDGIMSRGFQPINNTGNIETGRNVIFLSPESPENYYRRIMGAEIPNILRGEVEYIKPDPLIQSLDGNYNIVNLIAKTAKGEIRYQVTFDQNHGMLPVKIFRQTRADENSPWKDVLQHSILEWMPLENGVHYPKTGVQTIYHEEIQPTRLEVLSLVQDVDIQSLADSFVFPAGCEITDHRTGSRTKIERTSSDTGIDIEPQQISFFPKALGITLDDAMAMFNDILKE